MLKHCLHARLQRRLTRRLGTDWAADFLYIRHKNIENSLAVVPFSNLIMPSHSWGMLVALISERVTSQNPRHSRCQSYRPGCGISYAQCSASLNQGSWSLFVTNAEYTSTACEQPCGLYSSCSCVALPTGRRTNLITRLMDIIYSGSLLIVEFEFVDNFVLPRFLVIICS